MSLNSNIKEVYFQPYLKFLNKNYPSKNSLFEIFKNNLFPTCSLPNCTVSNIYKYVFDKIKMNEQHGKSSLT